MSEYIAADLRREVAKRAQGCCEYCRTQERFSSDTLTVDHIIPRALEGTTRSDNLALSCFGCNQHKSMLVTATDPVTGEEVPLFNPRQQSWESQFTWNKRFHPGAGAVGDWASDRRRFAPQAAWAGEPAPRLVRNQRTSSATGVLSNANRPSQQIRLRNR